MAVTRILLVPASSRTAVAAPTVRPASITEWMTEDDPSAEWPVETSPWPTVRWTLLRLNDTAHLATATPGRP
jgi:hypothetical protein